MHNLELDTIISDCLYAIKWDAKEFNEFDSMANDYNDSEFLLEYFTKHKDKLKYFKYQTIIPYEAAIRTQKEANTLLSEILELESSDSPIFILNEIFEPLHSVEAFQHPRFHTDVKAKGYEDTAPWVRVYAVKCEDSYVITGYGLKLVKDMRDDELLIKELEKLDKATQYLKNIMML